MRRVIVRHVPKDSTRGAARCLTFAAHPPYFRLKSDSSRVGTTARLEPVMFNADPSPTLRRRPSE